MRNCFAEKTGIEIIDAIPFALTTGNRVDNETPFEFLLEIGIRYVITEKAIPL